MTLTTNLADLPYKDMCLDDRRGEYWEDIPGLDGLYHISNFGRIKRLERTIYDVLNRPHTFASRIKTPQINKDRNMLMKDWTLRLQAIVQVENIVYYFQIARLVYYCFVNAFNMNDANLVVTTKNGNGLDIRPENLILLTYTQKNHRAYDTGRQKSPLQTNKFKLIEIVNASRKKTSIVVSQFDVKGDYIQSFRSIVAASKCLGIEHTNICSALKYPIRKAGGYYWRYGNANKINLMELRQKLKEKQKAYRQKVGLPVTQFDLDGNILASYCAKSVASKKTGIPHKLITENINGLLKQAGGYIWRSGNLLYVPGEPFQTFKVADSVINGKKLTLLDCRKREKTDRGEFSIGTKVTQFKRDGEPIARYDTLQAAADAINCRYQRIAVAIKGKIKMVGGYIWREGHHYQRMKPSELKRINWHVRKHGLQLPLQFPRSRKS